MLDEDTKKALNLWIQGLQKITSTYFLRMFNSTFLDCSFLYFV